jgi:DNA-binding Xre family transcriptional regulator
MTSDNERTIIMSNSRGFKTHLKTLMLKHAHESGEPITQKQIAEATGISQPTLSRWYQGQVDRLEYDTVEKLMRYFGCDLGDLVSATLEDKSLAEA